MKAIILNGYGNIENFELRDIPKPPVKPGEIRIKIMAASFNPVDYQIRKGLSESRFVNSNILGRDLSGIVDEVHPLVTHFKKGDEVYCYVCNLSSNGTYAEYASVPAAMVSRKPVSLSHLEAAAVPVAGITAWLALNKTKAAPSKSIFIAGGAGGVGSFTLMLARNTRINKIITSYGSIQSRNYLLQNIELEESQVINYKDNNYIQLAIDRNGGQFDICIDLVGGKMLSSCCKALTIDGHLASVTESPGLMDFDLLFLKNASFHSIGANAYSLSENPQYLNNYRRILNYIAVMFDSNGMQKPQIKVIGGLNVNTVRQAHYMLENNMAQGKLVMSCY